MSVESNSDCFGLSLLRDWLRELVRFLLDHSHSKLNPMSTHRLLEVFTLVLIGCERARKRALFFNQSDSNQNQLAFSRALNCWLVFTLNFHWLVLIKLARSFCSITCKTLINCHVDSQCFLFKFPSAPCGVFLFISLAVVITFILIFRHLRKIRFSFKPQFQIALDQRKTFYLCRA